MLVDLYAEFFKVRKQILSIYPFRQWGSHFQSLQYFQLFQLISKHTQVDERVLDWGGGAGHVTVLLQLMKRDPKLFSIVDKWDVWSTFTSPESEMIFFDPNGQKEIEISGGDFDCVISCGVLEHVRETGGSELTSLRALRDLLKSGGKIIIYHLPQKYSYIEFMTRTFFNSYSHPYRYNLSALQSLTEEVGGLKLLEYGQYQILPRRIFKRFRDSKKIARVLNEIDHALCKTPLSHIAQCQFFVMEKD